MSRFFHAFISPSTVASCRGDPDTCPDRRRFVDDIEAGHRRTTLGRHRKGREDANGRGLPGAVVAEQSEHPARRNVEVQGTEGPQVAEALAEPGCGDAATPPDAHVRMAYCVLVHSTTYFSSTLYGVASEKTRKRGGARGRGAAGSKSGDLLKQYVAETVAEAVQAHAEKHVEKLDRLGPVAYDALDLWTRMEPGSRRPRFTREEIAGAAVHIADTEGIDALSMRRLATELGAGTMTLYHYVPDQGGAPGPGDRHGHGRDPAAARPTPDGLARPRHHRDRAELPRPH